MNAWLVIKLTAGLFVLAIVTFTAILTYHVAYQPLGGVFEKIIPEAGSLLQTTRDEGFAKALEAEEMPDFEPGDEAFQKAHALIALGDIEEGKEKLRTIVNLFSSSPSAPAARKILSAMNLDEILSHDSNDEKTIYEVQPGDSYYAIASREETTLDAIMYFNDMLSLRPLQPGDQITILPLNYRIMIDLDLRSVSIWDDARFIADYPIRILTGTLPRAGKTNIKSKRAAIGSKIVSSTSENYRSADKSLQLANPSIQILPYHPEDETPPYGIFLKHTDLEELFLLTRVGNTVEIRASKK